MKHLKRLISALLLTAVLATAVFASAATIKDVPAKNWAYPYVSKMVDMEIMQTHDGGYFYPDLPTSRGEFVLYLWRAMHCLLYTSPSPRDMRRSRMPSSA